MGGSSILFSWQAKPDMCLTNDQGRPGVFFGQVNCLIYLSGIIPICNTENMPTVCFEPLSPILSKSQIGTFTEVEVGEI